MVAILAMERTANAQTRSTGGGDSKALFKWLTVAAAPAAAAGRAAAHPSRLQARSTTTALSTAAAAVTPRSFHRLTAATSQPSLPQRVIPAAANNRSSSRSSTSAPRNTSCSSLRSCPGPIGCRCRAARARCLMPPSFRVCLFSCFCCNCHSPAVPCLLLLSLT